MYGELVVCLIVLLGILIFYIGIPKLDKWTDKLGKRILKKTFKNARF